MTAVMGCVEPAQQTYDLPALLAHRRWVRRTDPFPHVVAQNVFTPEFYAAMHEQYLAFERMNPGLFQRSLGNYDATAVDLRQVQDGPLGVFLSRPWHDLMAGLFGVQATGDVSGNLHHHDPHSQSGWPHADFCPGWFPGPPPGTDEIRLSANDIVDYRKGPVRSGIEARETIRAVSLLFYLGNPDWTPGDGGETALFGSGSGARREGPAAVVPPVNNSLVMFECTPFSWHTFLTNTKPRNAVVMWVHRSKADAIARWGERAIAYW